ncbi:MAG: response regulator [Myxococcota bacterium]
MPAQPAQDASASSDAQSATLPTSDSLRARNTDSTLAKAFEAAPQAMGVCDRELRFVQANAAMLALLGFTSEEILGHAPYEFIPGSRSEEHIACAKRTLETGESISIQSVALLPEGAGSVSYALTYARLVAQADAPEVLLITLSRHAVEVEPAHLRAFLQNSSYAMVVTTMAGMVLSWNAGAELLFGYAAHEIVGNNLELLTSVDRALAELPRRAQQGLIELEAQLRRKDGSLVEAALVVSVVNNAAGEPITMSLVARDVSMRKALEKRVHTLSQLEAVARVAAGVAHDVNNVLTIVSTYASFVAQGPLTKEQAHDLDVARDAAGRGAALVGQLLGLGRNDGAEVVVVELGEVARGIDEMLRRTIGRDVELTLNLPAAPLPVRAAVGQLDQVLLNLSLNARDAMPRGGRLTIGIRNSAVSLGHPLSTELAPGPYAVISVKDSGSGMDAETLARIFEPFFTTKKRGEGTGLGLLIVREIVKQLHGAIRVASTVGEGTEFVVYLPVHEPRPRTAPPPAIDAGAERRKTVLVVEDDVTIRSALRRILHSEGYAVLEAADGLEASEVAANFPGTIDLLLCDLLMPRVDGRQTVANIREVRPEVRVVFISGQPLAEEAIAEGAGFVQKPFSKLDLLTAVTTSLERPLLSLRPLPERPVVLIVDDSVEFRDSLVRLLEESELIAMAAKSGLHALQILENQHVDMVVTDQFMPGIDGVRLLELVRNRWPQCLRVLFTGYASSDVLVDAVNRGGAHRVLVKSMHPVAIRDQIEAAVLAATRFHG